MRADAAGADRVLPSSADADRAPVDEALERARVDEALERARVDEALERARVDEALERAPADEAPGLIGGAVADLPPAAAPSSVHGDAAGGAPPRSDVLTPDGSPAAAGEDDRPRPPLLPLVVALATVYVVWGSTYLAIAIAIETIPPFLLGGVRFLLAGAAMFAWSSRRGDRVGDRLGPRQWRAALVVGGLLLAVGNGGVSWAEQSIPSGLAALIVATVPLWIALWARMLLGQRLRPLAVAGLVVGLGGVAVLVQPGGGSGSVAGVVAVLVSALAWGGGSAWSRRAALPARPLVATSMQMLAGGAVLLLASALNGEWSGFAPAAVSGRSLWALAYLVVFGSIVAFTAYMWLLRSTTTALTSTYAYVNPIVAVLLGWAVLGEAVTPAMVLGGGVIVVAVALIVTASSEHRRGHAA